MNPCGFNWKCFHVVSDFCDGDTGRAELGAVREPCEQVAAARTMPSCV